MRILILATRFKTEDTQNWLCDELAHSLAERGGEVWVVVGSPTIPRPRGMHYNPQGIRIDSVGVTRTPKSRAGRVWAMLINALRFRLKVRELNRYHDFNGVVFTSISLMYGRSAEILPPTTQRLHIMWDFFPVHHMQIGSIPRLPFVGQVLKSLERWAIGSPNNVLVMSERGRTFFREYHPTIESSFQIQPPWSEDTPERTKLPAEGPLRVIFGGQLAKGRGVDKLIHAAAILHRSDLPIELVVAGTGSEESRLRALSHELGASNTRFVGQLSRAAYTRQLTNSHVGVAITDARVDAPSFPSKIGDYARVGLPILVATEPTSDVGNVIQRTQAGLMAESDSPRELAAALAQFIYLRDEGSLSSMSRRSREFYESEMSAAAAAQTIIEAVEAPGDL